MARILVVDDEEDLRFTLGKFLLNEGYEVVYAGSYAEAMEALSGTNFDLIISDIILGDKTGINILQEVKERNLASPVIMMTGQPSIDTAAEALRLGAFDYIPKPITKKILLRVVSMALQHKALVDEKNRYRSNLEAIFRSVRDAILTVDSALRLIEVNQSAERICGISGHDIGKAFKELSLDCNRKCLEVIAECQGKKETVEIYRHECRRGDYPNQVVNITASPLINTEGIPCGCVVVIKDETRLATLERDLTERRQFHNIIGKSDNMQKVYALIEELSDVDATVLITGETGTGKELIAEALHYKGVRGDKPLVKVNCSALSENLLESELFGHVKGAFTGAIKDKAGRFQMAEGGTLFLDEIGDISPKVQQQLLRVLQEKTFERVGDSIPVTADVRIVAATNKDLQRKIRLGEFREDLYYRLKVVEIKLPPLRERKGDLPLLVTHFLEEFSRKLNKSITGISQDTEKMLMEYDWPGNVRELAHVLEHVCIVCRQPTVITEDLPPEIRGCDDRKVNDKIICDTGDLNSIRETLEKTGWNVAKAARLLGMSRPTIYKKISEIEAIQKKV